MCCSIVMHHHDYERRHIVPKLQDCFHFTNQNVENMDTTKCLTLELLLWASVAGWLEWILKMPGIPLQNVIAGTCKSECARYCRSLCKDGTNYKKAFPKKRLISISDYRVHVYAAFLLKFIIPTSHLSDKHLTSHPVLKTSYLNFFLKKVHFFVKLRRHNRLYYIST